MLLLTQPEMVVLVLFLVLQVLSFITAVAVAVVSAPALDHLALAARAEAALVAERRVLQG